MNKCIIFLSVSIRAHAMTTDNAAAAKKTQRVPNDNAAPSALLKVENLLSEQNKREKMLLLPESHAQSWTDSRNASTIQTRSLR